jgi:hypothetical protein
MNQVLPSTSVSQGALRRLHEHGRPPPERLTGEFTPPEMALGTVNNESEVVRLSWG